MESKVFGAVKAILFLSKQIKTRIKSRLLIIKFKYIAFLVVAFR